MNLKYDINIKLIRFREEYYDRAKTTESNYSGSDNDREQDPWVGIEKTGND